MTPSMRQAIEETDRRRAKQLAFNQEHGITARSIIKAIDASLVEMYSPEWAVVPEIEEETDKDELIPAHELDDRITGLRREMMAAADKLDYERAAELRDRIKKLERKMFAIDRPKPPPGPPPGSAHSRASDLLRGRFEAHKVRAVSEAGIRTRGRKSAGAAGAAPNRPVRQGKLKLVPDQPK